MKLLFILLSFIIISCAHHRDVRPSDSGEHKVIIKTDDKSQGYKESKSQADHFCEQSKKTAYIVKEEHKYTGTMKEDEYNRSKTAAKVAKGVGGAAWVLGGEKESNAGGIIGLGGQVADSAIGKGYTYTMIFKCK